ncbi:MAG TPA: hypothetical protein ENJ31_07925 [Anaerolineae bacterium]|nr:hypothetical protein [Anaerolineae bacterium]
MPQPIVFQEADREIPEQPRARSGMFRQLWVALGLPAMLEELGITKYSGLPADALLFVYALFGVISARSIQHLVEQAGKDVLLQKLLPVLEKLNDKALRYLLKRTEPESYQSLLGQVIRTLQGDRRMASRPEGIVAGDDTIEFKDGVKMPGIQVLFKASEGRYHLGYAVVSTHYADDEKDYPLLFDIRRRSEEEEEVIAQEKERRALGLDLRKTTDYLRWVDHQIEQGEKPELAILRAARFNPKTVKELEGREIPWIGLSPRNRVYQDAQGQPVTAKTLLRRRMNERVCVQLPDSGRQVLVEQGRMKGVGEVLFLITLDVARDEPSLFVVRRREDATEALALLERYLSWEQRLIETKLHQMVHLLTEARRYGIRAETVSLDRWFYVAWFIPLVLKAGYRRVVVPDRADRYYQYQGQRMTGAEIRATLSPSDFHPAAYRGKKCRLASRVVEHEKLGRIKLVFVEEFNKKDQPTRRYGLMCTDPDYADELVYRAHKLRWKIEEGYREMRQHHGFGAFHSRNWNAIHGHFTFVFLSLLLTIAIRRFTEGLANQTLGWIKEHYLNAVVELRETAEALVILLSRGFLQQFGLFQLVPGIGYVDW